jgi:hypothetical protein
LLIEDILLLSKIEAGNIRVEFVPVSLNEIMENLVYNFELQAKEKGLVLKTTMSPDLPLLKGAAKYFQRILTNLLDNAFKFTQRGSVEISAQATDGQIIIEISDTGIGIMPEDLEKIFNRFAKGHNNPSAKGSGLGLAIVKNLTEVMEGKIFVTDEGQGTRFRLVFNQWEE